MDIFTINIYHYDLNQLDFAYYKMIIIDIL